MIDNAMDKLISVGGGIFFLIALVVFFLTGYIIKTRPVAGIPVVPARIMRYLILPTTLIYLICYKTFELLPTCLSIKITEIILALFFFSFVFNFLNDFVFSYLNIFTEKESLLKLGRDVIHFILIVIVGACLFSEVWAADLGNLLTALGVISLVIGLAL